MWQRYQRLLRRKLMHGVDLFAVKDPCKSMYLATAPNRRRRDGQASSPGWLVISVPRQLPIPVLTGIDVEQLRRARPARYRYGKAPPSVVWRGYNYLDCPCPSGTERGKFTRE